ncbi:MAG: ATP-dependent sacrificial sulfur transferase LarE [Pirellula sp.]
MGSSESHATAPTPLALLSAAEDAEKLVAAIAAHASVVVAYSGGVDSAVVAAAAVRALGPKAIAWTGIGPAVAESERESARRLAAEIGIRHVEQPTRELDRPGYIQNGPDRCFHCKDTLYGTIRAWADAQGFDAILSGTNRDDLGDYRPGLQAADQWRVVAPLADLGIGKARVRAIAEHWQLSVSDKPASPCLASRVAYGQSVTMERLKRIEAMEAWLIEQGFHDVRARLHADDLLRIELHPQAWSSLLQSNAAPSIVAHAQSLGFKYVTLALGGRASGSMNRVLQSLPILP